MANIKVHDRPKLLGVTINDSRQFFKVHKEDIIKKAVRLANMTYSVTACCSRMMFGKVYWKCIALPSILYGTNRTD